MKHRYSSILAIFCSLALWSCTGLNEQGIVDNYISVTPTTVSVGYESEIIDVTVDANCVWTVSKTDANGDLADWIKTDKISGKGSTTFQIKVLKNKTDEPRQGSVNLKGDNASAFIDITQALNPNPDEDDPEEDDPWVEPEPDQKWYTMPVYEKFESSEGLDIESGKVIAKDCNFSNAYVDGNVITFYNGLVIEKTGGPANFIMLLPCHTNPRKMAGFQIAPGSKNFVEGDSWIFKIPLQDGVYGDLRFTYGSRNEGTMTVEKYAWSSDEGATWNPIERMQAMSSDAAFKSIWFTVPGGQAVQPLGSLWIKITPTPKNGNADADCNRFNTGFTLDYAKAPESSLPAQDASSVIISEGFDHIIDANGAWLEVPGFLKSGSTGYINNGTVTNGYSPANSAIAVKYAFARPGFLQVGAHDEALPARCGYNGELTLKVGDRLKEMGLQATEITLSFKAAGLTNAFERTGDAKVVVKSGSEVVGKIDNLSIDKFADYSFKLNADQSTVLVITSEDVADKAKNGTGSDYTCDYADFRFFVDDILVTTGSGASNPEPGPSTIDLEFDFTVSALAGWPTTDHYTHVVGGTKAIYPLNGTNYEFLCADCTDAVDDRVYWHANGYIILASAYRYFGMPAISGYKLTKISAEHGSATKDGRWVGVCSGITTQQGTVPYVTGGEILEMKTQGEFYTWNLSGTEAGKVYYIYCQALGVGISKVRLTYSK